MERRTIAGKNTHISDRSKDTSSVGVGDGTIFGVQWTKTEFVLLPSIGGRGVGGGAVNRVKQFFGIPEGTDRNRTSGQDGTRDNRNDIAADALLRGVHLRFRRCAAKDALPVPVANLY